jgi:hypothetical protein
MKLGIGVNLFKRQEQKGTPIRDGLVAEYLFDEGRGQVLCDYSGNGNHGMLGSTYNIDTNDPLWVPEGLSFDGVDDYVDCGNSKTLQITQDLTMQLAVYIPADIASTSFFMGKRYNGEYEIGYLADNGLAYRHQWAASAVNLNFINFFDVLGKNYTVAVTRDTSSKIVTAYKSGIEFSALTYPGEPEASNINLYLGARSGGGHFTLASIYCAFIYNRCLSPAEILENDDYIKILLAKRGVTLA